MIGKTIFYYDSLSGRTNGEQYMEDTERWLVDEWNDKKKGKFSNAEWKKQQGAKW